MVLADLDNIVLRALSCDHHMMESPNQKKNILVNHWLGRRPKETLFGGGTFLTLHCCLTEEKYCQDHPSNSGWLARMRLIARKLLRSKNDELFLQGDNVTGCATVDARRQILQMCPGQRVGYCHHLLCHCNCHQQLSRSEGASSQLSLLSSSSSPTTLSSSLLRCWLGKPSYKKSAVFFNIVQTGGEGGVGSDPCWKIML